MHQNLYLHLLFNQCTSMLTDVWYKDALLIKRRTFEMFGHGFIIVNSQVVASVDESSQSPFSVFSKTSINSDLQRSTEMSWLITNSVITPCLAVSHLPSFFPVLFMLAVTLAGQQQMLNNNSLKPYLPFKKKMPIFIYFHEDKHTSYN